MISDLKKIVYYGARPQTWVQHKKQPIEEPCSVEDTIKVRLPNVAFERADTRAIIFGHTVISLGLGFKEYA